MNKKREDIVKQWKDNKDNKRRKKYLYVEGFYNALEAVVAVPNQTNHKDLFQWFR